MTALRRTDELAQRGPGQLGGADGIDRGEHVDEAIDGFPATVNRRIDCVDKPRRQLNGSVAECGRFSSAALPSLGPDHGDILPERGRALKRFRERR
jgi:hypothetical protein